MMIIESNANLLYSSLLRHILDFGEIVHPRGRITVEIPGLLITLSSARHCVITIPERKLNYPFMVAEALWIMLGREDVEMISHYNKNISQFSDDGYKFYGAYGPRIMPQMAYVLNTLRKDAATRQAVLTIWRQTPPKTKDVPCTLSMQFLIRDGRLHCIVHMRSSDAWWGVPYDLFTFATIQAAVAGELHFHVGSLTITMGSSHLYAEHWDAAREIVKLYPPNFDWNKLFATPPPVIPGFPGPGISNAEKEAREHGTIQSRGAWLDYIEVLAYRTHRNSNHGAGYFMNLIRRMEYESEQR